MDQLFVFEIVVTKVWINDNQNDHLFVQCTFGDIADFLIINDCQKQKNDDEKHKDEGLEPSSSHVDFGSGKSVLFPSTAEELVREFETIPLRISVKGEDGIPVALALILWQESFVEAVRASVGQNLPNEPCQTMGIYLLQSAKDGVDIGKIEIYVRVSSLGTSFLTRCKKSDEKFEKATSFRDLRKIMGNIDKQVGVDVPCCSRSLDPSTTFIFCADQPGPSTSEVVNDRMKSTSFLIGTPQRMLSGEGFQQLPLSKNSAAALTNLLSVEQKEEDDKTRKNVKFGMVQTPSLEWKLTEKITSLLQSQTGLFIPGSTEFTVLCNPSSCVKPPNKKAPRFSCSAIFGPGSAVSKFCKKSKKPLFPPKAPCSKKTCMAHHPCRPEPCGPCGPMGTATGLCCKMRGKICARCGGFSESGKTCMDIKRPFIAREPPKKKTRKRNPYDCLRFCPSKGKPCIKMANKGAECMGAAKSEPSIASGGKKVIEYVHTVGERLPISAFARHQFCLPESTHIPANMGSLWTYKPQLGIHWKIDPDWQPGFISPDVRNALDQSRSAKNVYFFTMNRNMFPDLSSGGYEPYLGAATPSKLASPRRKNSGNKKVKLRKHDSQSDAMRDLWRAVCNRAYFEARVPSTTRIVRRRSEADAESAEREIGMEDAETDDDV